MPLELANMVLQLVAFEFEPPKLIFDRRGPLQLVGQLKEG